MIVTLAGHVDHGKTSLVRALTGVDTDRLAEEKARGLTIDLGFAYAPELSLGFVDVPGHRRFIHNMVAGVASHQYALLVIAADDGPMPQTQEHLQILSLIGVSKGVIALNKADLVSPERLEQAREEIEVLVSGTFLENAKVFPCSAQSGDGVDPIRQHLANIAANHAEEHDQSVYQFRMPVDRAFNVKGSGTVVTGTVHSGHLQKDQNATVFPSGQKVRVRGLRSSNNQVHRVGVSERVAINLTGVEVADVQRGTWIALDATASNHVTIELDVLDDFPRTVRHWTPVHVYHATTHRTGRLALLEGNSVAPGQSTLADIELDGPLLVRAGDRLLVRDQSLDTTLGGGTVREFGDRPARRRETARLSRLEAVNAGTPEAHFEQAIQAAPLDWPQFASLWGLPKNAQPYRTVPFERIGDTLIATSLWQRWIEETLSFVTLTLEANPNLPGLRENELPREIPQAYRADLLKSLAADKKLVSTGGQFHLPRHSADLPANLATLFEALEAPLNNKQPPSVGDLAKQLNRPLSQFTKDVTELCKRKALVRVSDTRIYLPAVLDALAEDTAKLAANGPFSVREYRDFVAVGRNVAIEVLEHFDRRGFTRRQENSRVVVGEWAKLTH